MVSSIISASFLQQPAYAVGGEIVLGPTINLTNTDTSSGSASVATNDGANVYVVWQETVVASTTYQAVYFKRSTDGGNMFGLAKMLSISGQSSIAPQIAVSGSNVNVAWEGSTTGFNSLEILSAKSTDGSAAWSTPINLGKNMGYSG